MPARTPLIAIGGSVDESDEELFTVPDLGAEPSSSKASPSTPVNPSGSGGSGGGDGEGRRAKVRRGRNPQDREHRRLKRLLRNRVSAQQARERKKVYVSDLESMAKVIRDKNAKLAEKISTLVNENSMLRKVLVNMRPKADEGEGAGTLDDQLGNSGSSFS
ncbi:unnamed protein product [Spirodela intermedia]|uniref:BZIP domain-containing protein n=1 Tax=Spirodela intermedia TaxID=51605 RepID=A0A7I8JWY8_SPIIN|nr:unnamed protein product [Spirodela intermedia]